MMLFNYKKYFLFFLFFAATLFFCFETFRPINQKTIVIKEGKNNFPKGLEILEKENLIINHGAILVMGEGTKIEIKGRIVAKGTKEKPIIFTSENNTFWRGIEIIGQNENLDLEKYKQDLKTKRLNESSYLESIKNGNIFVNCHFENLAPETREEVPENRLKGAIEANNTTLLVSNSIFKNILYMGGIKTQDSLAFIAHNYTDSKFVIKALHFVRSFFIAYNNKLEPNRNERHTWSVGIYNKSGVGIILKNEIWGFPDNGIDNDNDSLSYIINNDISNSYDDGVDVDYNSEAFIVGNKIDSIEDNGIIVSEKSTIVLANNKISNAKTGLALRNGGKVIAKNLDISQCKYGIEIFNQVPLLISKKDFSKIKKILENLDKSYFDYYGGYTIKNKEEAINLLEKSYTNYDEFLVFNKKDIIQDLTSLFKTINIFDLEDIKSIPSEINKEEIDADFFYNEIRIDNSTISADENFLANSFFTAKGCCLKENQETANILNILSNPSIFQMKQDLAEDALDISSYIKDLNKKIESDVYKLL